MEAATFLENAAHSPLPSDRTTTTIVVLLTDNATLKIALPSIVIHVFECESQELRMAYNHPHHLVVTK
jgi:hypothetical protein